MLKKENGFSLPVIFKFPDLPKYLFIFISLFIILISIYSNSFYGDWHFDDYANIVDNPYIQIKSFSWSEIKHCIYGLEQDRPSRPLSYLSFALNYYFHGKDVFGYHVVNFAIHFFSSVFLFLFIFNTLRLPRLKNQYKNIAYPIATIATFFWAVHPVWVTSVTYVVQRMASMAGLFYIASMYFYLKARTSSKFKYSLMLFSISLLLGLASVLTKENAAMLPVSILLFDLFFIAGITKENVIKYAKIAFLPFLIILFIGFIYVDFSNIIDEYKIRDFTMLERVMTQPRVILFYLSLLLYPISSRLTFLYDIEVSRSLFQPWTTIPSIFLIIFVVIFALYIARKRPLISFCIIFYFLNHLIEGSIFNLELIYEHRNYLPAMLLFVPVAELIIYAIDYFSYNKIIQFIVALGIAVILIGEGDVTYNRNKIASDDYLLWFDNIEKYPALSRPHANTGRIYFIYNEKEKALQEYKKAMVLNKYGNNDILAIQQCNLGILYFETMQNDQAMECFRKSSEILPDYIQTNIHMAKIKLRQNKIKEARQFVEDKLKKYRSDPKVLELYSFILLKDGQIKGAQYFARKLLEKDTDSVPALMIMAEVCRIKYNYPVAILYWKAVRSLSRQNVFANLALIELYAKIKDTKMLDEEIRLLFYLKGPLELREYIRLLNRDKNLNIYVPILENFSFVRKECFHIN